MGKKNFRVNQFNVGSISFFFNAIPLHILGIPFVVSSLFSFFLAYSSRVNNERISRIAHLT